MLTAVFESGQYLMEWRAKEVSEMDDSIKLVMTGLIVAIGGGMALAIGLLTSKALASDWSKSGGSVRSDRMILRRLRKLLLSMH